jgi:hypothetical protein
LICSSTAIVDGSVGWSCARSAWHRGVRPIAAIVGFDRGGEAQVGQRVLVRAAHAGVAGQGRQQAQRRVHLRRRAFEQAAAAGREQVSPQNSRGGWASALQVGDVAGRVAGHVDDLEAQAQHLDAVAAVRKG